jgi:hypothetical protein
MPRTLGHGVEDGVRANYDHRQLDRRIDRVIEVTAW